jgi:hypothetical protein
MTNPIEQTTIPGLATAADERAAETDHAEREDDPTPRLLVRAVLAEWSKTHDAKWMRLGPMVAQKLHGHADPTRVLDVCAGYGCWASEMRRLAMRQGWPVHITGVEIAEARREHLAKWCDETIIANWLEAWAGLVVNGAQWDIAIGNPHFTALANEDPEQSMPAVLLRHAPAVLLLHTQQAFVRGAAGREVWRRYPAAAAWLVPGSVGFRGPGQGTDARCYQVSLWLRGHDGPTEVHLLPELPAHARRWTVPPGSEEPSDDLPAAPGWRA